MLKVEVKGTGARKAYTFSERVVVSDDGSLKGEGDLQDGWLLATAGRTLKVADLQALGVAAALDAALKVAPPPQEEPKAQTKGRKKRKR
jgi:hypothetical protein